MGWLTPFVVGLVLVGIGAFVAVLTSNLDQQPEYPTVMFDVMRVLGSVIVLGAVGTGSVFLVYAVLDYVG